MTHFSAYRRKYQNRSANFFGNHPERLYFKFQTYILNVGQENRANTNFLESQKCLKREKLREKVTFFASKLYYKYDLVSCTTEGQHIKFEVI